MFCESKKYHFLVREKMFSYIAVVDMTEYLRPCERIILPKFYSAYLFEYFQCGKNDLLTKIPSAKKE